MERRPYWDAFGNRVVEVSFAGTCRELRVESELEVETLPPPELVAWLPPLPWVADTHVAREYLGAFPADETVRRFAESLASEVSQEPLPFLDLLARTLHARFDHDVRASGDARSAAETLATRRGACRDLTVLFMEATRSVGIASRFVSGYQAHAESVGSQRDLHAWPELLIPGAGFRGWDPTHGVRVTDGHVPLAAAPEQRGTMPIDGSFSFAGEVVNSTLDFSLHIETTG